MALLPSGLGMLKFGIPTIQVEGKEKGVHMKEEYLSIIRSLKDNVDELIAPLDIAQTEFYGENIERVQNSLDLIMGELLMVILIFSSGDGVVLDRELDVINDMREVVHGHGVTQLTSHDNIELGEKILNLYSVRRYSVDVLPVSVQVLQEYDKKHNTSYRAKARELFVQFIDAMVAADNNEHHVETVLLGHFKEILNSS